MSLTLLRTTRLLIAAAFGLAVALFAGVAAFFGPALADPQAFLAWGWVAFFVGPSVALVMLPLAGLLFYRFLVARRPGRIKAHAWRLVEGIVAFSVGTLSWIVYVNITSFAYGRLWRALKIESHTELAVVTAIPVFALGASVTSWRNTDHWWKQWSFFVVGGLMCVLLSAQWDPDPWSAPYTLSALALVTCVVSSFLTFYAARRP